jgi:hypothetical protein
MAGTHEQDLLLRAALLDGAAAIDAWHAWRERTSIDALDRDSQWLLPRLFYNLRANGVSLRQLGRYHHVYRHNWYKNNLALRRAQPLLDRLQEMDGRSPVVIGGAAMALQQSEAIGARPFEAVDVLVASSSFGVALDPSESAVAGTVLRTSLFGTPWDDLVAARAIACEWMHARWLVPAPADHLVAIAVYGPEWDRRSNLLWLADAAMLIRRLTDRDWANVAALAYGTGRIDALASTLRLVSDRCGIPAPIAAWQQLDSRFRSAAS